MTIEIRKGTHVLTLREHIAEHKKDIMLDVAIIRDVRNYTTDQQLTNLSYDIENKILNNNSLTNNDVRVFYKLRYLYYLKNFFPLTYDVIDYVRHEYYYLID